MNLQNVEQARYYMIEQQIRPWDVSDDAVLGLLASVKREDFVPLAQKSLAFVDMAIALPGGQCMLPPRVQARLLQDAAVNVYKPVCCRTPPSNPPTRYSKLAPARVT